jgi:hypothetical protein
MTTLRDLFPSNYICAEDLKAKDRILTIASIEKEEMYDRKERKMVLKPVLYFEKAQKGLVLNITMARVIEKLYGKNADLWISKRIIIFPTEELSYGEVKDVVRVRPALPPPAPTPASAAPAPEAQRGGVSAPQPETTPEPESQP